MSTGYSVCHNVRVVTFRGNRTPAFSASFLRALDDERQGRGPGPTREQCLLHAGHSGVMIDGESIINGFNPDRGSMRTCDLMDRLKMGDSFPGIVYDDTPIFIAAASVHGLKVQSFRIRLPDNAFREFRDKLDSERQSSKYSYGFPNGNGDCNCTTWLERLGLPLLTGRMDEFVALPGFNLYPTRRFGQCI